MTEQTPEVTPEVAVDAAAPKKKKERKLSPLEQFVATNMQRHIVARFGKHREAVWVGVARTPAQKHMGDAMLTKAADYPQNPLRIPKNTLQNKFGMSGRQWVRLRKAIKRATKRGEPTGLLSSTDA